MLFPYNHGSSPYLPPLLRCTGFHTGQSVIQVPKPMARSTTFFLDVVLWVLMTCYLAILCDLFGMVSSRDPFKGKKCDLQRSGIKGSRRLNHLVEDSYSGINPTKQSSLRSSSLMSLLVKQPWKPQACHGQKPLAGRKLQDGHAGEQKWLTQKIGGVAAEGKGLEVWKVAGNFCDSIYPP